MFTNRNYRNNDLSFPTIPLEKKETIFLRFLYHTKLGRILLWVLIRPTFSKIIGSFLNTRLSSILINPFIQKKHINMARFQEKKYSSFNDFFCRKLKEENQERKEEEFISPCDGKLSVYKIKKDFTFQIKHSTYSIKSLLQDDNLAKNYQNGTCLIFRLTPDDYHRYHFIDNGIIKSERKINGVLHTVRPIALEQFKIFHENTRVITNMKTEHFGSITQIEVGALMVGKIWNKKKRKFKKGEEKGMFLFGGSTIILLLEKSQIKLNPIFLKNTQNHFETQVHFQDILGLEQKK